MTMPEVTIQLYIFIFLHQTTTGVMILKPTGMLYIFIFLHQTTTESMVLTPYVRLYIFIFLHQTTTQSHTTVLRYCLYIFIFLHQTTTHHLHHWYLQRCISLYSYIKPQPHRHGYNIVIGCISLYSYIKPQLVKDTISYSKTSISINTNILLKIKKVEVAL